MPPPTMVVLAFNLKWPGLSVTETGCGMMCMVGGVALLGAAGAFAGLPLLADAAEIEMARMAADRRSAMDMSDRF